MTRTTVVPDVFAHYPLERDPIYGCWLWLGSLDPEGYAILRQGRNAPVSAHRRFYEDRLGPVQADRVLDHLCRRRSCVNPAHLEPVKRSENERRKYWRNRAGTERLCPQGHRAFEHGRLTPEGGRICRLCSEV